MTHDNLKAILDNLTTPISKIEADLGMPSGTLAKAKKGVRELPNKWDKSLSDYFLANTNPVPVEKTVVVAELKNTKMVVDNEGLKNKPKNELLREVMGRINKDFGEGSVMLMSDAPNKNVEVISTGSMNLDAALGVGGLPKGRVIEIYGQESSGKTTLAIHVIAEAQKKGGLCAMIDAEHAFDSTYAKNLGVNLDMLHISQPDYGEQALEIADRLIISGQFAVVVIDSVAALVPKSELEGEMGDSKMGLHARLMSQALRKMTGSIAKSNTVCIFINQLRDKIGVMFGSPETTTGGNALKFYASVRLDVRRSTSAQNTVMNGDVKEGNQTTVKVVKNKVAPPFKVAQFNILYGKGIDTFGEIVDLGVIYNVIEKSGSWFSYNGDKIGQGKNAVAELLRDNEELANEIKAKVKSVLNFSKR